MRRRHQRYDLEATTHFVTAVTRVRGDWFVNDETCTKLLLLFEKYRERYRLVCFGYVLMPDHLHALLFQETDGPLVSQLMNSFKREASKQRDILGYPDATLWRDRYDDIALPGSDAISRRMRYMHGNPVERGLVAEATEYKWSSLRYLLEMDTHSIVTLTRR
ncbi:transposase [bacterium]|nr:transposase [bacterium]